ncbi:MAG: DoxX family protein [Chthoniobacterales bacterium]
MPDLHTPFGGLTLVQLFISALFAICFLQSGIDKIVDRKGNLEWLTGHFSSGPLAGLVPLLFFILTVLELAAGALSAIGCVLLLVRHDTAIAFYGVFVSALALLALFFGQRIAKEYPGAAALVPYFIVALAGLYFLA